MTEPTLPLVPAEVDLRDFAFMPLDVQRLRDSDLASDETPEACWAAVLLWCASWHQVPAASIPDNDQWQAKQCGYVAQGKVSSGWKRIRNGALRGWVPCSDGRLYHPVVAEKALESWRHKLAQRWRSEVARIKKHNQRHSTNVEMPDLDTWIASGCPQGQTSIVPRDTSQMSRGQTEHVPGETTSKRPDRTGTGSDRTGQGPDTLPVVVGAEPPAPPPAAAAAATQPDKPDRGARLPKDWQLPKAWGDWALAEFPQWTQAKVRAEAANFADHWHGLSGKDATKVDWLATWRKWCRNPLAHRTDPKPGRPNGTQPDLDELTAGVQRRLGITPANPEAIDA